MKKILTAFILTCLMLPQICKAEKFPRPASVGTFKVENLEFSLQHFEKKWKHTRQSAKVLPGVSGKWGEDNIFRLQGVWNAASSKWSLKQSIAPQGQNSFLYEVVMEQQEGNAPQEISLGFALDPGFYAANPCMLDGKPVKFGKNYNAAVWQHYFHRGKKLVIPMQKGTLVIEGNFSLVFQDTRRFQSPFWMMRIKCGVQGKKAALKLKFTYTPHQSTPVSIAGVCNMAFADEVAQDGKGGWTDEGPGNDMRKMPLGKKNFAAVDFSIIDPAKNKGVSCIVLKGTRRPDFPGSVTLRDIPEGNFFALLHAVGWQNGPGKVGKITFVTEDGKTTSSEVRMHHDIGNFWNPQPLPNGAVGLETQNELSVIGLYVSCFEMPKGKIREIRIESYGKIVWMIAGASVANHRMLTASAEKQVIRAGKDWQPIPNSKPVKAGSILDFSGLRDAPAGKYGKVRVNAQGKLYFEKAPERKVRFYGANICHNANYMEKHDSEKLVRNLAAIGYNTLRIHHIDCQNVHYNGKRSTEFSEKLRDRFDYLFYLCKQNGIYLTTDLYCYRLPLKGEITELGDWTSKQPDDYKALIFLSDAVFENWKEFSRNLLNHTNPYTKTKWKDDPTLWSLNLVNEDTIFTIKENHPFYGKLYKQRFDEFVKSGKVDVKNVSPQTARLRFLAALYRERYQQMMEFLRKEIGTEVLVSDQNFWNDIPTTVLRDAYDVVDNHLYFEHPHFLERPWWLPVQLGSISGVMGFGGSAGQLFPSRIFGKPFIITEWDHVTPAFFAIDGAFLMGAYGAFQDWDGLYHFAYAHRGYRISQEEKQGLNFFFDLIGDVQRQFAERAGAMLFLRGDVQKAGTSLPMVISAEHLNRQKIVIRFPAVSHRTGLLSASGTVIAKNGKAVLPDNAIASINVDAAELSAKVPSVSSLADVKKLPLQQGQYEPERERFVSDTGELTLDRTDGTFTVCTPKSEAFILPEQAVSKGKFIRRVQSVKSPYSAFAAISRDDKPLEQSCRILLFHLTESKNTDMTFRDRNRTILEKWGTIPVLARKGQVRVEFSSGLKGYQLFALDIDGSRMFEVPLKRIANGCSFTADNSRQNKFVAAYELVKEK